ncbi:MAG TPA: hemerythrin domain-containing protein [Armatimonadota bacterium]|jgi:hemerythrin-like domain-containing protein
MPEATDVIRREHATIRIIIRILDELLARHKAGEAPSIADIPQMVTFFIRFGDGLHHAKEEQVLFPAILRHDQNSITLLDRLLTDHQQDHLILSTLEHALSRGDHAAVWATMWSYVTLMAAHVELEDNLLLPTADTYFTEEEQAELAGLLATVERERMPELERKSWAVRCDELIARYLPGQ